MTWTPVTGASKTWVKNTAPLVTHIPLFIVSDTDVQILISIPAPGSGWEPASSNSETWTPN